MKKIALLFLFMALALSVPSLAHAALVPEGVSAQLSSEEIATESARLWKDDKRTIFLKAFLESYKSPLADQAAAFVQSADKYALPEWRLVAAIAGVESTFGKRIPTNSYNAWGWAVFTGRSYGAAFESWEDGIDTVSKGLKEKYYDKGATTLEAIGRRYAASPVWAQKVRFFLEKMDAFEKNHDAQLALDLE